MDQIGWVVIDGGGAFTVVTGAFVVTAAGPFLSWSGRSKASWSAYEGQYRQRRLLSSS